MLFNVVPQIKKSLMKNTITGKSFSSACSTFYDDIRAIYGDKYIVNIMMENRKANKKEKGRGINVSIIKNYEEFSIYGGMPERTYMSKDQFNKSMKGLNDKLMKEINEKIDKCDTDKEAIFLIVYNAKNGYLYDLRVMTP